METGFVSPRYAYMTKRPAYPIPSDVKAALSKGGVAKDYAARPHYQQNDYVGWITQAKSPATRGSASSRWSPN
jgi:hypothetical protein